MNEVDIFKKPGTKDLYTQVEIEHLYKCSIDPIYFIKNFVTIKHPTKGSVPFNLYDYQETLIKELQEHRNTICLWGRQLGKCVTYNTKITHNNKTTKIGNLLKLSFKDKIVNFLENTLLKTYKYTSRIINPILYLLDKNHRHNNKIEHDVKKFTHAQSVTFKSDFGDVIKVFRTVPYDVWELKTDNCVLYGADKHIVIDSKNREVWIDSLKVGDRIQTRNGVENVISVKPLNIKVHMYCVEINNNEHLYYTNNILSHNTESICSYLLWYTLFNRDKTVLIVANKLAQAVEIMGRIQFSYKGLPNWLRDSAREFNKTQIEFSNGSRIVCRATTPDAGRGLSISKLYIDEMAFIETLQLQDKFWASIKPVLSTGGECIITSTPGADNDRFSQIWRNANDRITSTGEYRAVGINGFRPLFADWTAHPERDETWAEAERASSGEITFRIEHCCEFLGTGETLIDQLVLQRLRGVEPLFRTGEVRWYKKPSKNNTYVIGLDPSLGTGGDSAAIQILELPSMEQVGEWLNNRANMKKQVSTLFSIIKFITNEAGEDTEIYWSFENNTLGVGINEILDANATDIGGNLISEKYNSLIKVRKGLTTTNRSKIQSCLKLKQLLDRDKLKLYSYGIVDQLKSYEKAGQSFGAKTGAHDDLVSALLIAMRVMEEAIRWSDNVNDDLLRDVIQDDEIEVFPIWL